MSKRKRSTYYFIHCGQHGGDDENCEQCVVIKPLDRFIFSKFPRNEQVLGRLLAMNSEDPYKSNVYDVAITVVYIWVLCNVYTKAQRHVVNDVEKLLEQFKGLKKYQNKKKGPTFLNKLMNFKKSLLELFDIKCNDLQRNKNQTLYWGVRMEEEDQQFYKNQKCTPPIGICTNTVDRHAVAKTMRMKRRIAQETEQLKDSERYRAELQGVVMDEYLESVIDSELEPQVLKDNTDKDFVLDSDASKIRRYEYQPTVADVSDDMPSRYRHVRNGLRSVRPEVYRAAHTLNSDYHMSLHQIEGAFVEIGRLFDREWKAFRPNYTIDNDTLPSMTNLVRTRNYVEAMALNNIVEEVMNSDGGSITYSNDGSALNRVGSYVVQSITVNGIQRALPALSIVTESQETLKQLEITTLQILSAATGYRYTEADVIKKITFVMTVSTAHNIGVIQKVCGELDVDEADCPKTLLCNIHPLMLFQSKLKEFYDEIQKTFGTKKLDDCFTVDVDFKDENLILKAIKCLTNFVNKENSAKPWNRYSHFSQFIAPKKMKRLH